MELSTGQGEPFEVHPYGEENAPRGVLLIHDFWGVRPYNHDWARRFAERGYRALVIDLYQGDQPPDAEAAAARMREVDQRQAERKLCTALRALRGEGRRLGVLGWSFGGLKAQEASLLAADTVDATVFLYSRVVTDAERLACLRGPVLGLFSETERSWPEKQREWELAMYQAGKGRESRTYPAGHGFCNPDSPRFEAQAADAAWSAAVAFLDRVLA